MTTTGAATVPGDHFRLLGFGVRVGAPFFLLAVVLSGRWGDLPATAAWVAVVFASVLAHELGHALVFRAFGVRSRIELHGMGGTTFPLPGPGRKLSRAQEIAVAVAGPAMGFVIYGGVKVAELMSPSLRGTQVAADLIWVNGGWGVVNLLPILPLDGGHVLRALIGRDKPAYAVSITFCAVAAAGCVAIKYWWGLYLVATFLVNNVQSWQATSDVRRPASGRPDPSG